MTRTRTTLGLVLLLLLVLAGGAGWLLRSPRTTVPDPVPTSDAVLRAEAALEPRSELDSSSSDVPAGKRQPIVSPAVLEAAELADAPEARCWITGRVLDDLEQPVVGAQVELEFVQEPDGRRSRIDGRTAADGSFRLDGALPKCQRARLRVDAGAHFAVHETRWSPPSPSTLAPAATQMQDFGTIRLKGCGSIEARLVGADRTPLKLHPILKLVPNGGDPTRAQPEPDGRLSFEHVEPGFYRIEHVSAHRFALDPGEIRVVAGRVSAVGDLVVEAAWTISGIVVDERGQAVPNVRLLARPASGAAPASVTSRPDGTFSIPLRARGRHEVGSDDEVHGWLASARVWVEEGTSGLRLVAPRAREIELVVLDARTRERLLHCWTEFTFLSSGGRTGRGGGTPSAGAEYVPHVYCLPGMRVCVSAEGYRSEEILPEPDGPGATTQTVLLERRGRVSGRLMRGGEPAVGVAIRLRGTTFRARVSSTDRATSACRDEFFDGPAMKFSDAQGRFTILDVPPGEYALELLNLALADASQGRVSVQTTESVDLGEIHLAP